MSLSENPRRNAPTWVHWFVNYAGLAIFLATLLMMRLTHHSDDESAIAASWAIVGGSVLAIVVGLGPSLGLEIFPNHGADREDSRGTWVALGDHIRRSIRWPGGRMGM